MQQLQDYKCSVIDKEKAYFGKGYEDNDLVFATENGKPIYPRNFDRKFKAILKKAGLPTFNLHSLRHTFATRLLEADVQSKIAQELLGHSSVSVTLDIYSHVSDNLKRSNGTDKISSLFK